MKKEVKIMDYSMYKMLEELQVVEDTIDYVKSVAPERKDALKQLEERRKNILKRIKEDE